MKLRPLAMRENVEAHQRAALIRQRRIATGLLIVMALVFLAARLVPDAPFWLQLIRAASEAALVGGLADWFAVTALFRHPFGLPIPHTAIIPRNKNRIGDGLGRFVERNFLEPRLLAKKIRSIDAAARLSAWLALPGNPRWLGERMSAAVPFLLDAVGDKELRDFLRRTLRDQLSASQLAPPLGRLLEIFVEARHHQALFDRALLLANDLLLRNEERIYALVSEKSGWWVPPSIDRTIARKIITGVYELLDELVSHDHEARKAFDSSVHELIDKLKNSHEFHERIDKIKNDVMSQPVVQEYLEAVWDELRDLILADVRSPDSRLIATVTGALESLGRNLRHDEAMRTRLNTAFERAVVHVAVPWRHEIGRFIAEVVHSWDAETVTQRLELVVGRDLQFIRINGTVVGALVGILLFLVTTLVM